MSSSVQGSSVVVDLSHYNTVTSFQQVQQSGIVGVIHKATEGTNWTDPTYASRKPQALAAQLYWGAYHFGINEDGAAQAQYFLSIVNPGPQDLLALDFEQNPSSQMTMAQAEQFVTEIHHATGRYPGFYSDALAGSLLGDSQSSILSNCWFWRAEYGDTPPSVPPTWPTWTMWQYTESGSVPGIEGACDRDIFNGSLTGLSTLWGYAGNTGE